MNKKHSTIESIEDRLIVLENKFAKLEKEYKERLYRIENDLFRLNEYGVIEQ